MGRLIDADALLMRIADLGFSARPIEGDSVSVRTRKMTELFCLNFAEALIRNAPTVFDMNELMRKLATLDRVAKSDQQKALLGRVFFIIENMIEENEREQNDENTIRP